MPRPEGLDRLLAALAHPARPTSDYDLNPALRLPEGRALRPAAVLIGVQDGDAGPHVVLTMRASHLKHHPGQIAFPGGKVDATDADAPAAALREAWEEIGLRGPQARVLAVLDPHETVTGFAATPVLAEIDPVFRPVCQVSEVAEAFSVPLSFLMDPANYRIERRLWRGEWRHYYAVPYGPYYIWGATARMLKALADRVAS